MPQLFRAHDLSGRPRLTPPNWPSRGQAFVEAEARRAPSHVDHAVARRGACGMCTDITSTPLSSVTTMAMGARVRVSCAQRSAWQVEWRAVAPQPRSEAPS
jgi:hypothetical protein